MRKSLAVLATLGFLGATTVAPVIAAPVAPAVAHTDISAAKKKAAPVKHTVKKKIQKRADVVTDLSAAKKKAKAHKKAAPKKTMKKSELVTDLSAAKKKAKKAGAKKGK
ncbi:MAG TPA: hypothetical protein VNQ99_01555 [Xanthobacteraceae bacterium]|nr:hypothetical protein [Xanthobacteraceae bacterium]